MEEKKENQIVLNKTVDSIKLNVGMSGKVGYEIKVSEDDPDKAIAKLKKIHDKLQKTFNGEENEKGK